MSGAIYDITNSSSPVAVPTSPSWEACKLVRRRTVSPTQTALRRLLAAYTQAHKVGQRAGAQFLVDGRGGGEAGRVLSGGGRLVGACTLRCMSAVPAPDVRRTGTA